MENTKDTAPMRPVRKRLYYHQTDGGAEYLTDSFVLCNDGHPEGCFAGAQIVVRLDGEPEVCGQIVDLYPALVEALRSTLELADFDPEECEGTADLGDRLCSIEKIARALLSQAEAK